MELRIKDICKQKGLAISKLAEMIGTTNQNLFNTLNKSNPTLDTLEKIANALDVPVSDLISDPRSNKPANNLCPHCGKEIHITVS